MAAKAFVNMYYLHPILLCKSNIAKQNFCQLFNVICDGSEFWIYMETLVSALCVLIFVYIYLILKCIIPKNACIVLNDRV